MRKTVLSRLQALRPVALGSMMVAAAMTTQAATPFQVDVSTAIDRGIEWLARNGAYNNPSSANDASGLAMLALLEKRASGNAGDPPQGYLGANATDQARLRTAAAFILDRANETSFYAYRDGAWMFGLASYALSGGPDKSVLAPGNADYEDIKQAMDRLVDRALSNQAQPSNVGGANPARWGYWCYSNYACEDSSTTQFVSAGLDAAKVFYSSVKAGDQSYADAARLAGINTALARTKVAYELNGAATGSDNASCNIVSPTERGHGYNSAASSGYKPSLAQTSSGIYIQLFGGSDVNTPAVQQYMEWVRNHYRWQDLAGMGNFWSDYSYWYYLWSSFKGMEVLRQSGVAVAPGNLGPNSYGTLAPNAACAVRQENKTPATYARVASFGAGAAGYYGAEVKSQYFDYAHQILTHQCYDGSLPLGGQDGYFGCNGSPSRWDSYAEQSYALLVLQRSTGVVIQRCDVDGDGDVDRSDVNLIRAAIGSVPGANDPRDDNLDGKVTVNDVRSCTLRCTRASCATN